MKTKTLKLRNVHNGLITEINNIKSIFKHNDNFTEVRYFYEGKEQGYHYNNSMYEIIMEAIQS